MCTDRIEVTKQNNIPFRISLLKVCKNLLDHPLGPSVRIGAYALRAVLSDRNLSGITINSCRRRENNIFNASFSHLIDKCYSTGNIVLIVFNRLMNRFSNSLKACEMNGALDIILTEDLLKDITI